MLNPLFTGNNFEINVIGVIIINLIHSKTIFFNPLIFKFIKIISQLILFMQILTYSIAGLEKILLNSPNIIIYFWDTLSWLVLYTNLTISGWFLIAPFFSTSSNLTTSMPRFLARWLVASRVSWMTMSFRKQRGALSSSKLHLSSFSHTTTAISATTFTNLYYFTFNTLEHCIFIIIIQIALMFYN